MGEKWKTSESQEWRDSLVKKIWGMVDTLPQRDLIATSDARHWIEQVVDAHGEAAVWHAIRLNGFGGSEIGVLIRNMAGERADHMVSAKDIVEGKLMRRAPLDDTAHLRRGHENEEPHARRFWDKYGAVRDQEAFDALKAAQGRHLWMRYSPDELVTMPVRLERLDDGRVEAVYDSASSYRWLVDYKAPSVVDQSAKVALQYAAQLHQGAILCHEVGISLDGLMLSQYDWANWALKDDVVPWNPALGQAVLEAGDHYWGCVMRGEIPPHIITPLMQDMEGYQRQMAEVGEIYASLKALEKAASERAEKLRQILSEPLEKVRFAGARLPIDAAAGGRAPLTIASQRPIDQSLVMQVFTDEQLQACQVGPLEFDRDALEDLARSLGASKEQLRAAKKRKLDTDKVFEVAIQAGMDPERFVSERLTFSVDKSVMAEAAAYIEQNYPIPDVPALDEIESLDPALEPVTQ